MYNNVSHLSYSENIITPEFKTRMLLASLSRNRLRRLLSYQAIGYIKSFCIHKRSVRLNVHYN